MDRTATDIVTARTDDLAKAECRPIQSVVPAARWGGADLAPFVVQRLGRPC